MNKMKYLKTWNTIYDGLPRILQKGCISYKFWKKYSKSDANIDVLTKLAKECKRIDNLFVRHFKRLNRINVLYSCLFNNVVTREHLYSFVELNKTCTYKICKRLDKRIQPCPNAKVWLSTSMKDLKFKFMGGKETTALRLTLPDECPICLESSSSIAIAKCGHYVCIQCLEKMYNMKNRNGTYINLIDYEDERFQSKCPCCRTVKPFSKVLILTPVTPVMSTRSCRYNSLHSNTVSYHNCS